MGRVGFSPYLRTTSSLSAFWHLFRWALCEHVQEINISMDDIRVEGFLSLEGAPSKVHQYLCIIFEYIQVCFAEI
ncbi:hypothetical protein K439DRAFT_224223 [Ramaria rubella]|nr:hypothetical protein K439DRAFT_224223 [Ramaria rubella]